ncbi:MAG TPA: nuclear transport factor 2 family protein, partial [Nevskiaceae bacterium]|nr:nuclear transport factor 2 family protein [Nevskiaceae bacterium]
MDDRTLKYLLKAADRGAIEDVLGTYCRAIDRLDVDLLKTVYHPDGVDDHGAMCLNAHEFAEQIIVKLREVCEYSMHSITQSVIDIDDGRAAAESYYIGYHTIGASLEAVIGFFGPQYVDAHRQAGTLEGRHVYLCGGRYIDVLHKRDGAWRIFRRKMTNEWGICRPEETS